MKVDVLCVGAASYDLVFKVARRPGPDEKMFAESFLSCGGGPAANAAVTVSRMGLKAAFVGYLGRDLFGDLHLRELEEAGVDTTFVARGERISPVSSVWVLPSGERSLVNYRQGPYIGKDVFDFSLVRPKVVLFDGNEPELSPVLLEMARRGDIPTVLDAGSVHAGTLFLFDKVDYPICSQSFALDLTGCPSPKDALEKLSTLVARVVVTMGRDGLIWKCGADRGSLPAFSVQACDTTGAGDIFHGAFAGCLALQKGWEEALVYASAAAAISCTRMGGRPGIPSRQEVEGFLAANL